MLTTILLAIGLACFDGPGQGGADPRATIYAGWNDELNYPGRWKPLNMANKARVDSRTPGKLVLSLGQTPPDWPYTFQWSGLSQSMQIDIARYPMLLAKVDQVTGYAHLDIDILDARHKAVRTLRSCTLNNPGVTWIDLSKNLDPATYTLCVRLIVGGENSGCSASYDWVRFVSSTDGQYLLEHPDFKDVRVAPHRNCGFDAREPVPGR